jgi:hypothetical protein
MPKVNFDPERMLRTKGLGAAIGKPALDRTQILSTNGLAIAPGKPVGID